MAAQQPDQTAHSLSYHYSTHAPLFERFMGPDEGHVPVGEDERGQAAPVDPETGAEYRALGGKDGKFSTDWKVGSYYPKNGFWTGKDAEAESLSFDALEAALREHSLYREDHFRRVILPDGYVYGEVKWRAAFMVSPVDLARRAGQRADTLERRFGEDAVYHVDGSNVIEAYLPDDE